MLEMNKDSKHVARDDVAHHAGVLSSTVSYVVNNGPRPVSETTRDKGLRVIKKLGYRPDAVARNLRRQTINTVGLIFLGTRNTYFAEVAEGIESVAYENNYMVVFCNSNYKLERELSYIDHLYSERTAGIIIFPATSSVEPLSLSYKYKIPSVSLDFSARSMDVPSGIANNFLGGYLATEHLLSLGHKRNACISQPVDLSHADDRVRGYLAALEDADIQHDPSLLTRG